MKHLMMAFTVFSLLLFVSCSGGSGGAQPLPAVSGDTGETVTDTPVPQTPVDIPDAGGDDYTDTGTTDTTPAGGAETPADTGTIAGGSDATGDAGTSAGGSDNGGGTGVAAGTPETPADTGAGGSGSGGDSGVVTGGADTPGNTGSTGTVTGGDTPAVTPDQTEDEEELALEEDDTDVEAPDAVAGDNAFDFATVHLVDTAITFTDSKTGKPIAGVVVRIYDEETGAIIAEGFSDSKGVFSLVLNAPLSANELSIVVIKPGYTPAEGYFVTVDNVAAIASIVRTIRLEQDKASVEVVDSDGDGIADADDEFPADKSKAKKSSYAYTIAFEDRYPGRGNADFNDAVIRYSIDEYVNGANEVVSIVVRSQVLAAGTNRKTAFMVAIAGKSYELIGNVRGELAGSTNTRSKDAYRPGQVRETEISFKKPLSRIEAGTAPYDPFLAFMRGRSGKHGSNEIHLSFVKTTYRKVRLASDGMPYALLVKDGWLWPIEGRGGIFKAYPGFESWYKSAGKNETDWQSSYDDSRVYVQAAGSSSLAGYLAANRNIGIITLLVLLGAAGGLFMAVRMMKRRSLSH